MKNRIFPKLLRMFEIFFLYLQYRFNKKGNNYVKQKRFKKDHQLHL